MTGSVVGLQMLMLVLIVGRWQSFVIIGDGRDFQSVRFETLAGSERASKAPVRDVFCCEGFSALTTNHAADANDQKVQIEGSIPNT